MTALVFPKLLRQIAELQFCIVELHRRQQTDRGRAWLWQLKEHAARQALAMLRSQVDEKFVELPSAEQRKLIANHWLLQDPRAATRTATVPKWRLELQTRARQALEQSLHELQQRRQQLYSKAQESSRWPTC